MQQVMFNVFFCKILDESPPPLDVTASDPTDAAYVTDIPRRWMETYLML